MNDADEELCLCGNGPICTCIFELDWMKDLLDPLYDDGFAHGDADGVECAIYDTRYKLSSKEDDSTDIADIPVHAYIDPCRYQRAYAEGFQSAYREVYQRHSPLLEELALYHRVVNMKIYLLKHFGVHPLLELGLLDKIENFIWPKK
jgi:hypothetical protein